MSRAFVKEQDGAETADDLPDRLISPHPNLVTPEGLALIEAEVARLSLDYAAAQTAADRPALAAVARDLRYWTARRGTAEVVAPPTGAREVHFGSTVTIERAPSETGGPHDGRRQTFRIVGEDEADPPKGTLSYVSPLARALMGKAVGDVARVANAEVEIVEVG
jgi:transcription elongation GreA/GreB family factor